MPAFKAASLLLMIAVLWWGLDVLAGTRVAIRSRPLAAPGDYPVTVTIEPHAEDRLLRIEADGQPGLYRSSDENLPGEKAAKIRQIWFNLSEGCYYFAATIFDNSKALASVTSGPVRVLGIEGDLCPEVSP